LKLPFGLAIDLRRKVGPGFFYGDLLFVAAAGIAWIWAKTSRGLRNAAVIMGAVAVFVGVSYGVAFSNQTGHPLLASIEENKAFVFYLRKR